MHGFALQFAHTAPLLSGEEPFSFAVLVSLVSLVSLGVGSAAGSFKGAQGPACSPPSPGPGPLALRVLTCERAVSAAQVRAAGRLETRPGLGSGPATSRPELPVDAEVTVRAELPPRRRAGGGRGLGAGQGHPSTWAPKPHLLLKGQASHWKPLPGTWLRVPCGRLRLPLLCVRGWPCPTSPVLEAEAVLTGRACGSQADPPAPWVLHA